MEAVINKYQSGKIYVIRSPSTEKYYIGSTCEKYLSNRFGSHNSKYRNFLNNNQAYITSFEIIKLGDAYIELLEMFPCNSKLELCKREGELIREHKENCVNKHIAGRTGKEHYEDNREHKLQYNINNKDKIKNYRHAYNRTDEFKAKSRQQSKLYYEKNKEKKKEQVKQYYLNKKKVN